MHHFVQKLLIETGFSSIKVGWIFLFVKFDLIEDCTGQIDFKRVCHAQTIEEACKLLEVGFEYVTDIDGVKLFRKRK